MREGVSRFVDVAAWADSAAINPVMRRQRQATHILLAAIARLNPPYALHLKGGLLLGLVHGSPRMTGDIDLTARFSPRRGIDAEIGAALDRILPKTVAMLGYVGVRTEVSGVRILPGKYADDIERASFPALRITVRHVSGSDSRKRVDHVRVDVSFNEPASGAADILDIGDGIELHAYAPVEVIAEKYRALLQQARRQRQRRQDVYDLDFLQARLALDDGAKAEILNALIGKCQARGFVPDIGSFDDPEVRERAGAEWDTMGLEAGRLPDFGRCFGNVRRFYRQLPWSARQCSDLQS